MSKVSAILACTTVVAVIMVVQLWHQLHLERISNQDLQVSEGQGVSEPSRHAEVVQTSQQLKDVTSVEAPVDVAAPLTSSPSGRVMRADSGGSIGIDMQQLLKNPKFMEAQQAQARLQMPQAYPDIAQELGLTPEETDEFFDLLTQQQFGRIALTTATREGDEESRREAGRKLNQAQRSDLAAMAEFLGPSREQAWQNYQQSLGARRQVTQLGALLSAAGHPFTDSQVRPLVDLIATEQRRLREESRLGASSRETVGQAHFNEAMLKATEESNSRIMESARAYLNTQQLSALETSMAQRSSLARIMLIDPRN